MSTSASGTARHGTTIFRHEETILWADLDRAAVCAARRYVDPVGHYHRPDVFRLTVDTRPRPAVTVLGDQSAG